MASRLEVLQRSLEKKKSNLRDKFDAYFSDVKQANGQPLNDKRNGSATLNRWSTKETAIRNAEKELQKTKDAIEREESKKKVVDHVRSLLPKAIIQRIEGSILTQWKKYPSIYFVPGVEKARIQFDVDKRILSHKYVGSIPDKDQHKLFASTYNTLRAELLASGEIKK